MGKSQGYEDLLVWQKAHKFVLNVYSVSSRFPTDEQFGLRHQLRRSAVSIPANICEGSKRHYTKEFIQFLHVAKGSLGESEYYILLAKDLGYMALTEYNEMHNQCDEIGRMLAGLINSLK